MAKYGEGDSRWIVQERPDGANVHNWHWAERDCLEWSRSFLSSRFAGLQLLSGPIAARTTALDKLEGEAYVNIRKGKIIPGYELSLTLKWEAEVSESGAKVKGTIEAPYIADENADEDPELRIVFKDGADGPAGKQVKEALFAQGKQVVLEKIREFVRAMAAGGPAKDELEVKKPRSQQQNASSPVTVASAATAPAAAAAEKEKTGSKAKEGFKTVKMTEKFYCRARDLYEILLDDNRWKGFTQSNASISREVGGHFSIFDGSVTGENLELQEAKLIVQRWRFGSWPDGLHSTVKLEFDEPEPGVTVVKLTQTDVPEEDRYGNATVVENTERGWRDLIFHRIRAVFGFGI